VQVVPPPPTGGMDGILRILDSGVQNRREQRRLDLEERQVHVEEERLRQSATPTLTPAPAPASALPPTLLTPELKLQLRAFDYANPDWAQYAMKMVEYAAKLRPGDQTDATEYLTLLYRLAKQDAAEGLPAPAAKQ
jgi:hypothetical protein